ncbi:MAG: TonB-dependent receptor [Bauldia sp.]
MNVTQAETAGVELSTTANIVPGKLSGTVAYTYLYSLNLASGVPLSRRPANTGTLALTYTGIENLAATLSATFVGTRYNDTAATLLLPAYTRVDLSTSYRLNDSVTVFGRIENLFNARYTDPYGYNTAGFSVYAGLTLSH